MITYFKTLETSLGQISLKLVPGNNYLYKR